MDFETDVAIVGAGPAGCTTSLFLSRQGITHTLFEKDTFPRDKICGDALSGKVVSLLKQIDPGFVEEIDQDKSRYLHSSGIHFVAPNGKAVDIPFSNKTTDDDYPMGFVGKRIDFDQFLVNKLDPETVDFKTESEVTDIQVTGKGVELQFINNGQPSTCRAKLIIGAGGARSVVAKKLAAYKMQAQYHSAGIRTYYENVSGMHGQNFIELHFLPEALPGYFWIFPLPNNQANVGIGMLTSDIRAKKLNLKNIMRKAIAENPTIKARFKDARIVDDMRGWGLPLGSVKHKLSGERFLLTGDAGSLIDPFSGEGIGNAMLSARFAAQTAKSALDSGNFSAEFLSAYDKALYDDLWDELKLSRSIQRLVRFPWLFNFVVNRIHNNKTLQETFSAMFTDLDIRAKLRSPSFYVDMFLKR